MLRFDRTRVTRRQFNAFAGAAGVALGTGLPRVAFTETTADSATIIKGKESGMIVHNAKLGVMETPLKDLRKHAITPKNILFNRLHFPHPRRQGRRRGRSTSTGWCNVRAP